MMVFNSCVTVPYADMPIKSIWLDVDVSTVGEVATDICSMIRPLASYSAG